MVREQKQLELSSFATHEDKEIIENPYRFLNLPIDSPLEEVRKQYIRLSKQYHPDLVDSRSRISLDCKCDSLDSALLEIEEKRTEAQRKMVLINRAYAEIKSRYKRSEWNKIFGYEAQTFFNSDEGCNNKKVELEGAGEIIIYPNHHEYFVAGPYLMFDYGPLGRHETELGYRGEISLKHLFAHLEINNGTQVNKVLVDPFIDCFGLSEENTEKFLTFLDAGKGTESIMKELEIPNVPYERVDDPAMWRYALRFREQLNEILFLQKDDDILTSDSDLTLIIEDDGRTILNGHEETIFTEADHVLFLTLAYGGLLN